MKQRALTLTQAERADLERVRDRDPRPYLREKAAALLKIASGLPAYQVARQGLLRPRKAETLYRWLNEFEQSGTLSARPACRGRFSPRRCAAARDAGASASAPAPAARQVDTGEDASALPGPAASENGWGCVAAAEEVADRPQEGASASHQSRP